MKTLAEKAEELYTKIQKLEKNARETRSIKNMNMYMELAAEARQELFSLPDFE